MQYHFLEFELSPWLSILCIFSAAIGSYLLYHNDPKWNSPLRYILIFIRFVCLFTISLLLLGPILNQVKNNIEKPSWVIAIDNSASMPQVLDSAMLSQALSKVEELQKELEDDEYSVELRTFDTNIQKGEQVQFGHQSTDIGILLKNISTNYEGRNLAGLLLISDGIHNRGSSPLFSQYNFPIHTVGMGDTIPKKDLYIQELKYNKISYQGNDFPISVTVGNKGYEGAATVSLSYKGRNIASKNIILDRAKPIEQILLQTEASASGLQKYTISITNRPDEYNTSNNYKNMYIDVIDGKERILVVAAAPHPDIKAISSSISTRNNYELITYIPSIGDTPPQGKFDLIIFHGLPDQTPLFSSSKNATYSQNTPSLIMPGVVSDIRKTNSAIDYMSIKILGNDNDQVSPVLNTDFSYFTISENLKTLLPGLPPLEVPYASIDLSETSSTLLYQRIGSVDTDKPILQLDATNSQRSATFIGEGLWRWRLYEYHKNGHTDGLDELILKLVQYLSTKEDKRKMKCAPIKNEITTNESVTFETEIYNDLYELVYDHEIDLTLTNESGDSFSYNFVNTKGNNRYKIDGLPSGIYQYEATTNIDQVSTRVSGELVVAALQIESLHTTANFQLLRKLALKNNGAFYQAPIFPAKDELEAISPSKGIIHSTETLASLINFEWLLIILVLLLSIEWFSRKYNGAY